MFSLQKVSSTSFSGILLPCSPAVSLLGNNNLARSDAMTSALRISVKHLGSGVFKEEMKCWLKSTTQRDLALLQLRYRFGQSIPLPSPAPLTQTSLQRKERCEQSFCSPRIKAAALLSQNLRGSDAASCSCSVLVFFPPKNTLLTL